MKKISIESTAKFSLTVATQFTDLHESFTCQEAKDYGPLSRRRFLHMALFNERFLVKDADLVNYPGLLAAIIRNDSGIRDILDAGILIPGLRETAGSFSEVNAAAGRIRAYPTLFTPVKKVCGDFDLTLQRSDCTVLCMPFLHEKNTFRNTLERLTSLSVLTEREKDLLRQALQDQPAGEPLRFGRFYPEIKKLAGTSSAAGKNNLPKWCKLAHILVPCLDMGLNPSFSDFDISPLMVQKLLGKQFDESPEAREELQGFLPKAIFIEEQLDALTFSDVAALRSRPEARNFFRSAARLLETPESSRRNTAKIDYIRTFEAYLGLIAKDAKIDLHEWQSRWLKEELGKQKLKENALAFGLPFAIGSAGVIFSGISLSGFTTTLGVSTVIMSTVGKLRSQWPSSLYRFSNRTRTVAVDKQS